jgi:uncharacterized protein (DUF488 family)
MPLFTIGYEGVSLAAVLASMKRHGVAVTLDVRDFPASRRAGFSKSPLRASLLAEGIDYVHLKALGTRKEGRQANRAGAMDKFWSIVEEGLQTPEAEAALAHAAALAQDRLCCLLCYEADHRQCHRLVVAARLTERYGFETQHLTPEPAF